MADPLSLLILAGRSPRHLFVVNRLGRAGHPLAIVQESSTQWTGKKVRRLLKPSNLARKLSRAVRDRRRYRGGGEARFFFGDAEPALERPDLLVRVPHVNHPRVTELARELSPDLICVFGTSLIRGELLSMGRLGMINLHGGLSPDYRGADCTFWALLNGEPEQVGVTLHYINAGIDRGKLVAHVSPEVGEEDDELTLFWRGVRDAAEVFADVVERMAAGERFGVAQPHKGRLYQVKDRLPRHERELEEKLRAGLLRGVSLPPRVRLFRPEDD